MIQLSDYFFELPEDLIARYPASERTDSRLLHLNKQNGDIEIYPSFTQILGLLREGDVLVYNSTRVSKRRVYLQFRTGRIHECLFLEEEKSGVWLCLIRNSGKLREGCVLHTADKVFHFSFHKDHSGESYLKASPSIDENFFQTYGTIPIPPYLKRKAESLDEERYQTIFAEKSGSVAAPTAGLHFSEDLKEKLKENGILLLDLCLNVGYGTFAPLEKEQIEKKRLHKESFTIPEQTANQLNLVKGKSRIISIGTTTLRALESCLDVNGKYRAGDFDTDIFIQPGDSICSIDGLITNFHLPESSLLMLVSAFAGKENVLNAYRLAVKERMRFFSYGDGMLII